MAVMSLPEDKPKIAFHVVMMFIQNFGFFIMYYDIWGSTPYDGTCDSTRFAVGFMALSCFLVSFLCVGMGMGGYTDDKKLFPFYWTVHAIVAVGGYTSCTYLIPAARYSVEGLACAALVPVNGERIVYVFYVHAALYFVYVYSMLSVTYYSFLKPTYYAQPSTD